MLVTPLPDAIANFLQDSGSFRFKKQSLVKYLVSKILGKIQGTEMLVDLENLGTR